MLRLAESALQEALAPLPKSVRSVPLLLGMPELHTTVPVDPKQFLSRLAIQSKAALDLSQSRALPQGRAAGLLAVKEAAESFAKGKELFVAVGGVDSYVDLYVLGTLDMQKRVRTEVNPDGFAPGEGAGFVLMTTESVARQHKLETLARITACSASREEGHIYSDKPYRGDGLAGAFESLFASAGGSKPAACVYASFNGEHYWAKELGVAVVRHKQHFTDDYQTEHPAECFGDIGAAYGPVMLGLACLGMKDGYRPSPAIVYSSSDFGDRAAVLVAKTEPELASPQRR
jgi:3-oxoacyl-[acyl-carrier-protein] synthase-1